MEKFFHAIQQSPLLKGIGIDEFQAMLSCVQGRVQNYPKNGVILLAGNPVETVGLVLSGSVQIVREDSDGKQSLLTELHQGELFAEVFACAGIARSPVTALAASPATVLHLNYRKVITTCSSSCAFHQRLIENMLALVAQKNLMLNQKLELLSKRTTRERLLLFLQRYGGESREFTIPYSHEELAAYLCVERSAMSAELSKMQKDGLIRYTRKNFELL